MAYDKVIDSAQLDGALTATASAIREKGGTMDALPWNMETGFASAVAAMEVGGADLNFNVVAYASEDTLPATAEENTIAIITTNEITSWIFSATEPITPVEGMVWIETGTESEFEFSVTVESAIMVYPIAAKQYISGGWAGRDAYSFIDGEWLTWWDGNLYNVGDTYDSITGGWEQNSSYYSTSDAGSHYDNTGTVTFNADSMYIASQSNLGQISIVSTKKAIRFDSNKYNSLKITATVGDGDNCFMSIMPVGFYDCEQEFAAQLYYETNGTHTLDISELNGDYIVCITSKNGRYQTVSRVWFE